MDTGSEIKPARAGQSVSQHRHTSNSDRKPAGAKPSGPLSYGWFSLGMGKGIKWVLWDTNITLQRQEKQGDKWLTTEELHLAPKVLKEMNWRFPGWLEKIEKNNGGKGFG